MNPQDKDVFMHALGQTMEFFGKDVDRSQAAFWYQALKDKPVAKTKAALLEYIKVGKFAPRPAHILELISSMTEQTRGRELPPPDRPVRCPEEIYKAWSWFIGTHSSDSKTPMFEQNAKGVDSATQERYLHLVNHEAQKLGLPDAIPEEYKLKEVWGGTP